MEEEGAGWDWPCHRAGMGQSGLGNGQQGEDTPLPPPVEFNSPSPKQPHTAAQLKGFIGQSQLQEEVQQSLPQPSSRSSSFCSLALAQGVICPPAGNSP